jgi:hypothetical protein
MVSEGVFGLTSDGRIEPKLPVALVPMLFGEKSEISLQLPHQRITLRRPDKLEDNLLVAHRVTHRGNDTTVLLKAVKVPEIKLREDAPLYDPATPAAPSVTREGTNWIVRAPDAGMLYVNGKRAGAIRGTKAVPIAHALQCFSVTQVGADGIESLQSPEQCKGPFTKIEGAWPRTWTAPVSGSYQVALEYRNSHGPINTGITAAVKRMAIRCVGSAPQTVPVVMPHSAGVQRSTTATFTAKAGARCTFELQQGFNMSFLAHNAHYTGGAGGSSGPLNQADVGALWIVPLVQGDVR